MDQILKNGKVTRPYLGIIPRDVTPAMAKVFGVKEHAGTLVGDVNSNSPAQLWRVQGSPPSLLFIAQDARRFPFPRRVHHHEGQTES